MRVTAETKLATRERILAAAQRLFAAEGFERATTRDLARAAEIGVGTLFNYFPTKEAVAHALIDEAYARAASKFEADQARDNGQPLSLEEELFAHVAVVLRQLKPFRKYVTAVLETELSPLANQNGERPTFQTAHLETVAQIAARHGASEALTSVALHLYWTLYVGVLAFWAKDGSPRQEDTLALLDESLAMFVGWLDSHSRDQRSRESQCRDQWSRESHSRDQWSRESQSRDQWSRGGSAGASTSQASPSQDSPSPTESHKGD
jgi:AcrR family transcriptional regulator